MTISMTGYGKATATIAATTIQIELKAVNSKGIDINTRMPSWMREQELLLRKLITDNVIRGKIDCIITEAYSEQSVHINFDLLEQYIQKVQSYTASKQYNDTGILAALLQHPDIQRIEHTVSTTDLEVLQQAMLKAIAQLHDFRTTEGQALQKYLESCMQNIMAIVVNIKDIEPSRTIAIKERLQQSLQSQLHELCNQNRLEQEMIFYVEKLDIQEELSRLGSHIDFFNTTLKNNHIEKGKKLGFIAQEMLREANTIGSKANDAAMQKQVVHLKEEIEKIKEQVLNII